jgi:hypothetical protein
MTPKLTQGKIFTYMCPDNEYYDRNKNNTWKAIDKPDYYGKVSIECGIFFMGCGIFLVGPGILAFHGKFLSSRHFPPMTICGSFA